MSTTATETARTSALTTSKSDAQTINESRSKTMYTVDDLLFNRSQTIPDVPLVAYPATARGRADYVHYTARDLDRFADHGASKYKSTGLLPQVCIVSIELQNIPDTGFRIKSQNPKLLLSWHRRIWTTLPLFLLCIALDTPSCSFQID